ncbi:class I SAM-dependent methyltransferase [Candidatus Marimicrobium litorale]|uniref:Class I SAM-dependent methyltransferase n=1 Tax=Candidatus Marimicrobium litorale TaxID=2518991 RepID=A0ABT3T8V1_9GAMM|nr:class I SAM-dependent methyltransferase [Candidatus Marimicrobium litorale]MCX2978708.1 class I SAM-dependent methyltransferase [Candidatus Marimicrobium litorale]
MLAVLLITAILDVIAQEAGSDIYVYSQHSRDGTGKFYMGREIAQVMGHRGASWLQRPEREKKERTDLLLSLLELRRGDIVADIGAGTGYFTLPMAAIVGPTGQVLAVDIQPEMLAIIKERAQAENVDNIVPVLASELDPMLPDNTVDVVLMVDAYHEFSYPREVMIRAVSALTENGRIILVEYRAEDDTVPIKRLHKMSIAQARREMSAVGLVLDKIYDPLPWQHIMVFRHQ